ncbi:MAG: MBL fold metallo-hydrolase, partial [Acidobacteria bacterium]|nr:MBL fold metallo-hydrolase [Acidobacteriota bacterium]
EVRFRGGSGFIRRNQLGPQRHLEIFFNDVDQGDSILIQTPEDQRILIDGGETDDAHAFITNKYRLDKADNYIDLEAVVATHSDSDHTKGLLKILEDPKIAVKRVFHNGLFRWKSGGDPGLRAGRTVEGIVDDWPQESASRKLSSLMSDFVNAARKAQQNLPVALQAMSQQERWQGRLDFDPADFTFRRLERKDVFMPPFDGIQSSFTLEVLWPWAQPDANNMESYPWYGSAAKTVNGNSIVLKLTHGQNRILLTGDLNEKSMDDLLELYDERSGALSADVYKAAHHGSQHFSVPFLKAMAPDAAVVSSGDKAYDRHGHPRAVLMGTLTRYAKHPRPGVFCTELAQCYRKLSDTELRAFNQGTRILYEKAIQGIVHLRSDGAQLYLGTVHGRPTPEDASRNINWKWDIWPDE